MSFAQLKRPAGGLRRWRLAPILAVAMCGVSALAANLDKLSKRCRAGEAKACAELAKIAKTAPATEVWLAALKEIGDAQTKAAIAEARFATLQTHGGVKRGVVLGRLVLCSPTRPPEAGRSLHLRGCLLVDGDRIQEVAASGVRTAAGSQEVALVIQAARPDEFALETLLAAMALMQQQGNSGWTVGGTSVTVRSITVPEAATVPMRIIGEWHAKEPRLDSFIRISTLEGEISIAADQLAPER